MSDNALILSEVITKGNLATLSSQDRVTYYTKVCESVGLNPLTKPFEYITLNGKLVLYALRTCTDQLRQIYKVSVMELVESEREGVFIVTAKVQNGEGRTDVAKGAVNIAGLKGDNLANALMKAETKAKRRATLSICGLGMLDETEIETIPGATPEPVNHPSVFKNAALRRTFCDNVIKAFKACANEKALVNAVGQYAGEFKAMDESGNEHDALGVEELRKQYKLRLAELKPGDEIQGRVPVEEGGLTDEELAEQTQMDEHIGRLSA